VQLRVLSRRDIGRKMSCELRKDRKYWAEPQTDIVQRLRAEIEQQAKVYWEQVAEIERLTKEVDQYRAVVTKNEAKLLIEIERLRAELAVAKVPTHNSGLFVLEWML